MLIYSPELSPRLNYILDIIFSRVLGISYQTTNLLQEFQNHSGPRLNYSYKALEGHPFLEASGLLYERSIGSQELHVKGGKTWKQLPIIYPVGNQSIVPFDLFSACFYLISRYEEYLPFEADEHHRFHAGESLAFHNGFIDIPIVDLWCRQFANELKTLFEDDFHPVYPSYRFEPTIDIDNAWAFLNKGFLRNLGALIKPGQEMAERSYRFQVWRGKQPDPYDQYLFISNLMEKHNLDPVFFILVGRLSRFDRNSSPANRAFRKLIMSLAAQNQIGLHPSYQSNSSAAQIQNEIHTLASAAQKEISLSRFHFLKLHLPHSYRILSSLGITDDYSMGFADRSGFRSGIAHPHPFFDLENNTSSELIVHPFHVMDVSLMEYMKLSPDEAIQKIADLVAAIREVGGTFSALWHNESLSEWKHWAGWSRVFKEMLKIAS